MTAVQLPLAASQRHNNQQLFADYFLDRVLPERADWQQLVDDAAPVMDEIAAIFATHTPSSSEAQTEDDLVKPILRALGHNFEVQAALKTPVGTKRPDYVFFRDAATRDARKGQTLSDETLRGVTYAVGDAKRWDRPLSAAINLWSAFLFLLRPTQC